METINIIYDLLVIGAIVWLIYKVTGLQQDFQDEVDFNAAVGEGQRHVNTKAQSATEELQKKVDLLGKVVGETKFKRKVVKK